MARSKCGLPSHFVMGGQVLPRTRKVPRTDKVALCCLVQSESDGHVGLLLVTLNTTCLVQSESDGHVGLLLVTLNTT